MPVNSARRQPASRSAPTCSVRVDGDVVRRDVGGLGPEDPKTHPDLVGKIGYLPALIVEKPNSLGSDTRSLGFRRAPRILTAHGSHLDEARTT
jgi:hypothetical protein